MHTHFEISNVEPLRSKIIFIAIKFCQFKSQLTMNYDFGCYKGQNHFLMYINIDEETLRPFVQSRESEEWSVSEVT